MGKNWKGGFKFLVALHRAEKSRLGKVVICPDSALALTSSRSASSKSQQDTLHQILQTVTRISTQGRQVTFLWDLAKCGGEGE